MSAGLGVDSDGLDLRSGLCVKETGSHCPATMLASPCADRAQHRQKVAARFPQHIFVPWRTVRITSFLQKPLVGARLTLHLFAFFGNFGGNSAVPRLTESSPLARALNRSRPSSCFPKGHHPVDLRCPQSRKAAGQKRDRKQKQSRERPEIGSRQPQRDSGGTTDRAYSQRSATSGSTRIARVAGT